jgi:hypothetical protein
MITDLENPFPGMNPWLQSHWHSVNAYLIPYHSGPDPRLPGREQDWAEQFLRDKGLRDDQD